MAKLIGRRHVRFIVLDVDDEANRMMVQDIVEPKVGASPFFWRKWLRVYAGRPHAHVIVESILPDGSCVRRRTIYLAQYARLLTA